MCVCYWQTEKNLWMIPSLLICFLVEVNNPISKRFSQCFLLPLPCNVSSFNYGCFCNPMHWLCYYGQSPIVCKLMRKYLTFYLIVTSVKGFPSNFWSQLLVSRLLQCSKMFFFWKKCCPYVANNKILGIIWSLSTLWSISLYHSVFWSYKLDLTVGSGYPPKLHTLAQIWSPLVQTNQDGNGKRSLNQVSVRNRLCWALLKFEILLRKKHFSRISSYKDMLFKVLHLHVLQCWLLQNQAVPWSVKVRMFAPLPLVHG